MTEIKIEKKKSMWPWMLLTLGILALLIYFVAFQGRSDVKETKETFSLINVKENNKTVTEFVRFIEVDSRDMGLDHIYTNQAFTKLIAATNAMADEVKYDIRADIGQAKEYAAQITEDKFATTHADSISKAANILTNTLQRMQQDKFPELAHEAAELRTAADSIKPDILTLDQKDAVKGFFSKAAELLKKMN